MKIKHQLHIFILLVVLIPVIAIVSFPINRHVAGDAGISSDKVVLCSLIITIILEIICISFTLHISKIITKSISFLQRATKRMADGEVSHTLERRKSSRGSNEITELIVNLEKMRIALREDDERRKRFVMGMSHDLRTPVAVIKGYLEAIEDGVVSEKEDIEKTVGIILSKTNQLETMINSLINFVKLETNNWKENLLYQPILPSLNAFAESCVNTGTLFNRIVKTSINVSETTQILFNKELFMRALENLYSNAQRYTKENDTIKVYAEEFDDEIKISIEDSGIGIAQKDIQYIFEIFYRASNSRSEPGHGIGLSVVKNIMDTHGWTIDVKSQVGWGTIFIITIPKTGSKT